MSFKKNLILPAILIAAAFFRLIWLDRIPHSVNGDELYYLLTAKSLYLTGHDISQTLTALDLFLFKYPQNSLPQAELLHFLLIPFIGPSPFTLFNSFLPTALLSIGIVYLIYIITKKLFNTQTALIAAFLSSVNPWLIFIGRSSYEMISAVFFYLIALYVLLITKKWKILLSLPFFIFAFYSYIATKLIFLPLAFIFIFYSYFFINKRQYAKQYFILFAILLIFTGFFLLQLQHNPASSRIGEINPLNSLNVAQQVNDIRKSSIANPLTPLLINKFTIICSLILNNLIAVFSPLYLAVTGDYFASLGKYGIFYPLDLLFLLIGSSWLFIHKKRLFAFLWIIILISVLPEVVQHIGKITNFTSHITLLFPFFIMITAVGVWQSITYLTQKKLNLIIFINLLIYLYSVCSFLNIYFFQMPLQDDFYNFPDRILADYISRVPDKTKKINIYTNDSLGKFKEFIFYTNALNSANAETIAASLQNQTHSLNRVTFRACSDLNKTIHKNELFIVQYQCDKNLKSQAGVQITRISDSGSVYKIYNDTTCSKYPLNKYISNITLNDLNPGSMTTQQFCQKFIIKYQ